MQSLEYQHRTGGWSSSATGNHASGRATQINAPIEHFYQILKDPKSGEAQCLRDLYITDPRVDKQRIEETKGGLLKDSHRWILDDAKFRRWRERQGTTNLLWIHGGPGMGKTMLLCGIINELQHHTRSDPSGEQDLSSFFFCEKGNNDTSNPAAVLRGLIFLLIVHRPSLVKHVHSGYERAGSKLFKGPNAWYSLRSIFTTILSGLNSDNADQTTTYLAIDALDECATDLDSLLSLIAETSSTSPRVKWLVTSRRRHDISLRFSVGKTEARQGLDLDDHAEGVSHALDAYIDRCASELAGTPRDELLYRDIQDRLRAKARGTFLYVSLVFPQLRITARPELVRTLSEAPASVMELYTQEMERIQHLESRVRGFCRNILSTAAVALRPLRRQELYALSGLSSEDSVISEVGLRQCGSFLTLRGEVAYFVHQSAKDFLCGEGNVLFGNQLGAEHRRVFLASLDILRSTLQRDVYGLGDPGISIDRVIVPNPDPLAAAYYSCEYWIAHLLLSGESQGCEIRDGGVLSKFLEEKFLCWLEALCHIRRMREAMYSWARFVDALQGRPNTSQLAELAEDARRFMAYNGRSIMEYPLQTYASALVFAPTSSWVKRIFWADEPSWATISSGMEEERWSPWFQTIVPASKEPGGRLEMVGVIAVSPGGTRLASILEWEHGGRVKKEVRVWDITTGICLWTLDEDAVVWIGFPPTKSDTVLATAGGEGLHFWDVDHSRPDRTALGNTSTSMAAFSPDGIWVAVVDGNQNQVSVWDWDNGDLGLQFGHDSRDIHSLAYSPSGTRLASAHSDEVRMWNSESGSCLWTVSRDSSSRAVLAFTSDGRKLVSASNEVLEAWDPDSSDRCQVLCMAMENDEASVVAISADGSRSAVAPKGQIKIWDPTTRRRLQTLVGYDQYVQALAFSPDGGVLACAGIWGLKLCRTAPPAARATNFRAASDHAESIHSIRVSANNTTAVSVSSDAVKIWNLEDGGCRGRITAGRSKILDVAISPKGAQVVVLLDGDDIQAWAIGTSPKLLSKIPDRGIAAAFSPGGGLAGFMTLSGTIKLWDIEGKKYIKSMQQQIQTFGIGSLVFSLDGRLLATSAGSASAANKCLVRVWDLGMERCIQELRTQAHATSQGLCFSPDSKQLAVACRQEKSGEKQISIWSLVPEGPERIVRTPGANGVRVDLVAFDVAESLILTNTGLVLLDNPVGADHEQPWVPRRGYGVDIDGGWITWDSSRVLLLPSNCRPDSVAVAKAQSEAASPSVIVLGCHSRRVVLLRFPDRGPFPPAHRDPREQKAGVA